MDKKRKASIRRYVTLAILVILVALLAALPLLTGQTEEENKASILTAEAVPGSISRNLLGGGPLEGEKAVEVRVPSGVKITKLLVSGGDNVAKGDPIAQIDKVSAMTAVTEIQDSMASIESDMKQLSWKITPGAITVNEEGKLLADGREIPTERIADYAEYFQLAEQHIRTGSQHSGHSVHHLVRDRRQHLSGPVFLIVRRISHPQHTADSRTPVVQHLF